MKSGAMKSGAFIISLERSASRFEHAQSLLGKLSLPAEILSAVDGAAMSASEIASVYRRRLHAPRYPFELRGGEIGCFLSHRKAWQQIVDRDLDGALILEDDVLIESDTFNRAIDFLRHQTPRHAYIQLPARKRPRHFTVVHSCQAFSMVLPSVTMLRTSGQWVTRSVAELLLKATERFDRPVDTTLQMHWITGIRPLALVPCGLSDLTDELGGSTIGTGTRRKMTLQKVSREINRAIYRTRIARLSYQAA